MSSWPATDSPIPTPYEDLLSRILAEGRPKGDRTGTGTLSLFGAQLRYPLRDGFPLLTTKKVYFRGVVGELLWFLRGDTHIGWLQEHGIHIWDEWATPSGELGPVYGAQWRSWPTPSGGHIDQILRVVKQLRDNPDSRRIVVSAWNVAELDRMALAPCHLLFQLYVADGELSLQVYQRSADMFLGVPFNIASYALLTHMFAQQADLIPGELIWTGGDCHIYQNHLDQVKEQLSRIPRPYPTLRLRRADSILGYTFEDVSLTNYDPHPTIRGAVSV